MIFKYTVCAVLFLAGLFEIAYPPGPPAYLDNSIYVFVIGPIFILISLALYISIKSGHF